MKGLTTQTQRLFTHKSKKEHASKASAAARPPEPKIKSSTTNAATVGAGKRSYKQDLLPWTIRTRPRGSKSNRGPPPPFQRPSSPPPPQRIEMDVANLPPKKRVLMLMAPRQDRYICHICGRDFANNDYLGDHMEQQHSAVEEVEEEMGSAVLQEPAAAPLSPPQTHPCGRCGRVFSTGKALGPHRRHCKM